MRMRLASHTGPPNWPIEKRYIQLLDETGSTAAAIDELLTCLQPQWYRADSWKLLSELHAKLGHSEQAARALAQARAYDVHLTASSRTNEATAQNHAKAHPSSNLPAPVNPSPATRAIPNPTPTTTAP